MADNKAKAILGLLAETPIHAGAGSSLGVVDLPIQREVHTQWPCIYGSSVKGALRDCASEKHPEAEWLGVVFGPDPEAGETGNDHAGALGVGEARLLLLPVRSLTTHFKWVTCAAALARLKMDAQRLGIASCVLDTIPAPGGPHEALVHQGGNADGQPLYLEELCLTQRSADLGALINLLKTLMGSEEMQGTLERQLVVVDNDIFGHLARTAAPVGAHNVLTDTKRSKNLWYEETLPPETLLYLCLDAGPSRRNGSPMNAPEVLAKITGLFPGYLRIGGNETVGMGWFRVSVKGS